MRKIDTILNQGIEDKEREFFLRKDSCKDLIYVTHKLPSPAVCPPSCEN